MKAISDHSPVFPRYLKVSTSVNNFQRLLVIVRCALVSLVGCSLLFAGSATHAADEVGAYLQKYAGDWNTSIEWTDGKSDEPMRWKGKSSSALIGSNWVASQHTSEFLGMGYEASESMGYDGAKGAWTSIWVSRMQSYVRTMTGSLSAEGRLKLAGRIQDENSKEWLEASREDCWVGNDRYVSQFVKKDKAGKVVEKLTVTHDRSTDKPASGDAAAATTCSFS